MKGQATMTKYRIVKRTLYSGDSYIVQRRWFWFFWVESNSYCSLYVAQCYKAKLTFKQPKDEVVE